MRNSQEVYKFGHKICTGSAETKIIFRGVSEFSFHFIANAWVMGY